MVRRERSEVGLELPPCQTVVETIDYEDEALANIQEG